MKSYDANGESKTSFRPGFEASMRSVISYGDLERNPRWWETEPAKCFPEQEDVCRCLVQGLGAGHIGKRDKHGNTMLHYLAGARVPNEALIDWLKMQYTVMSVWEEVRNFWDHTPRELYQDSEAAMAAFSSNEGSKSKVVA